jgi:hypothetical protein
MSKRHFRRLTRYRHPRKDRVRHIHSMAGVNGTRRRSWLDSWWAVVAAAVGLIAIWLFKLDLPEFVVAPVGVVSHELSSTGSANPTTSWTATVSSGASILGRDVVFVFNTNRDATTDPTISDDSSDGGTWTKVGTDTAKGTIWWKRLQSDGSGGIVGNWVDSTVTITSSGNTGSSSGGYSIYRGAPVAGDPFTNYLREANASGNETHAQITPSLANSMICFAVFNTANDNAISSWSTTDPGALTERFDHISSGGSDCGCAHASALQSGGPTATGSFTWAQTNGVTESIAFAIPRNTSFPELLAVNTGYSGAAATSHDVDLPLDPEVESGKQINPGRLLIAQVVVEGTPAITWPSGWVSITGLPTSNSVVRMDARYRVADGTEGSSITISLDSSQALHSTISLWKRHSSSTNVPVLATTATGNDANVEPPTNTPGATRAFAWVIMAGVDDNPGFSTNPAGYTAIMQLADNVSSDQRWRQAYGSSENPDRWGLGASQEWISNTLAISPGTEGVDHALEAAPMSYSFSLAVASLAKGFMLAADPMAFLVDLLGGGGPSADDDFNRTNENPLASPWVAPGSMDALQLSGNEVRGTDAAGDWHVMYNSSETWADDHRSQVKIIESTAGNFEGIGPAVRINTSNGNCYAAVGGSDSVRLYKVTGVASQTSLAVYGTPIAANDLLTLEADGDSLVVKVNGAVVISTTDSDYSSGSIGMARVGGNPVSEGRMDDWEGGDLSGGGGAGAALLKGSVVQAEPLAFSVSLQAATLLRAALLSGDPLAFAVALQDADLAHEAGLTHYEFAADPLSFALTLEAAAVLRDALLSADPVAYAVALSDATVFRGFTLVADPLSFTISLQDAVTLVARMIAADPLAYGVSLQDAAATAARLLTADPLTYTLTLQGAQLLRDALLKADPLGYSASLQDVQAIRAAILSADPLAFAVTLQDAELVHAAANELNAEALSFSVTLSDAGLEYTPVAGAPSPFIPTYRPRRR